MPLAWGGTSTKVMGPVPPPPSAVVLRRIMRIVAGSALDPWVIRVAFAFEDPVGLKAHVVQPVLVRPGKYVHGAPMTSAAELLGHVIRIQAGRIEYAVPARPPGFG